MHDCRVVSKMQSVVQYKAMEVISFSVRLEVSEGINIEAGKKKRTIDKISSNQQKQLDVGKVELRFRACMITK